MVYNTASCKLVTGDVGRNKRKFSGFFNNIEDAMLNGSGDRGLQNDVGARRIWVPVFLFGC